MTSLFMFTSYIPSISHLPCSSLQCGERGLTFHPFTSFLKRTRSAKKSLGLRCSGASPAWKLSRASSDLGKVFVLSTTKTRWRFTAEARVVHSQGGNAPSHSIPTVFKFILDIFDLIFKLPGTLWALFTKEKSVLAEIEEDVDKVAESVKETTKIVEEVAESVEKVSKEIDEDAKKADALLEKMNAPPGNMEKAAEAVRESAKLIEKAAENLEKLSKVVDEDAEKVDALAEKVESTTKIIHEDIDEVFGSLGSSAGKGTKPQSKENETKDVRNDKVQGSEVTATSSPGSTTSSSQVIADGSVWSPWASFAQTLLAGNYLDAGIGRIATRAFLMAVTLMVIDFLFSGTGLGVQKHWLQLIWLSS